MKNHIVLLLVLSLVSVNSLIIGSQEAQEIPTQIDDSQELTLNDTGIEWLFSEHNPANQAYARIDSYTDAQPNDGYRSDYQSGQGSEYMPYSQWLVRLTAHTQVITHDQSHNRDELPVVSDSDLDLDLDSDNEVDANEVYPNARNQRHRTVSPAPSNALHRTHHVGRTHN